MDVCLIFNVGSSSLKWTALAEDDSTLGSGDEDLNEPSDAVVRKIVAGIVAQATESSLVGHRIVHGGTEFQASVLVDATVRHKLDALAALDPLHMRPALAVLDAARRLLPHLPHFAAFDTAFHRSLSPAAAGYALPHAWTQRWPLRRFGFHGLSVEWSVQRARDFWTHLPSRLLVAHLGSGCSVTAVHDGVSIDTTMGFTPLDGLMMGTRCGAIDPGLLLYLQTSCGIDAATLQSALSRESGLLGVSGLSADLRKILAAADAGHALAKLAYDRFIVYGRRALGAMAGSLGGADAIVFTGGIGEHSARVRADLALALGADLIDQSRNRAVQVDGASDGDAWDIGAQTASVTACQVKVLVVAAREDRIIARDVRGLAAAACS